MNLYDIALYPGDGIGPEVVTQAVKALDAACARFDFKIQYTEYDWGCEYFQKEGRVAPKNYLEILARHDAIFMGALGDPAVVPDHVTVRPIIEIRQNFAQYVGYRPGRSLPGVRLPLSHPKAASVDLVIVRENSEGEYFDCGATFKPGLPEAVAVQTALHTRGGVERILRYAFDLAMTRRRRLTMATKSNVLKHAMVLWDGVYDEVRRDYPEVVADKYHVDALCLNLVVKPWEYDVIVGSNLFADILSDLVGGIVGGLGLVPGANINPARDYPSLFEPVHGSALDITGKGIANPIAAIRTAGLMLNFLGEAEAGRAVEAAVEAVLLKGAPLTPDLGGSGNCEQVGDAAASMIVSSG